MRSHLSAYAPQQFAVRAARVLRAMAYLRLHGVDFDGLPYIQGRLPRIRNLGRISAADGLRIDGLQYQVDLGTGPKGVLEFGRNVFINRGATIYAVSRVRVGDHTRIADLVSIHDSDLHEVEEHRPVRVAPVEIGRNVWIGRGAVILRGVEIGDHAVVAAHAVVTEDVPARTLVAGVPAREIRKLRASDGWIRR